jgi:AcrR family transcriptional regulator
MLDTRRLILSTAEELFMQHGYANVSMQRLVEKIHESRSITKPAIYYYFRDKAALYEAVLTAATERFGQKLRTVVAEAGSVEERLRHVTLILQDIGPEAFTRMRFDITEHLDTQAQRRLAEVYRAEILAPIATLLTEVQSRSEDSQGKELIATAALMGLISGLMTHFREDQQQVVDWAVKILLYGITSGE